MRATHILVARVKAFTDRHTHRPRLTRPCPYAGWPVRSSCCDPDGHATCDCGAGVDTYPGRRPGVRVLCDHERPAPVCEADSTTAATAHGAVDRG